MSGEESHKPNPSWSCAYCSSGGRIGEGGVDGHRSIPLRTTNLSAEINCFFMRAQRRTIPSSKPPLCRLRQKARHEPIFQVAVTPVSRRTGGRGAADCLPAMPPPQFVIPQDSQEKILTPAVVGRASNEILAVLPRAPLHLPFSHCFSSATVKKIRNLKKTSQGVKEIAPVRVRRPWSVRYDGTPRYSGRTK